jgi:hypothetical protein
MEVPEIEDTPPTSSGRGHTLQEVPKEGQQEEDAVKDTPVVGAAAMAIEVWGSWRE